MLYIFVYTTLDKGLRKNVKKKEGMEKLENIKEMEALNMKQKKWNKLDKSKRSSYSPVVFKYDCSLETYLELWTKKAIPEHLYFSKNFKIIPVRIWILKSDYRFFYFILVSGIPGSIIFDQLLTNHDTVVLSE